MNLLIFLDLTYNPGINFKFYSLQGQNFKIFLIFTYNQHKVFLILLITWGDTCMPGLHWEFPPGSKWQYFERVKLFFSRAAKIRLQNISRRSEAKLTND